MKNLLFCTAAAVLLGACAATPPAPSSVPVAQATQASTQKPGAAAAMPTSALPPYKDPTSILFKERTVYFDFDSYLIKPVYDTALIAHATFLGTAPAVRIRVEGNTDERGGAEYNLALGQKRAEALKKVLVLRGAKESQVEAISYGKEKPKAAGHDEAAWSQNRRAEIVYP